MSLKIICQNKKATFNYEILERFEAGLVLQGSEVKSLRDNQAHLGDAYGVLKNNEIFLINLHISEYKPATYTNHDPLRSRKLLLHKAEINKLTGKIREKGLTLIPLKLYFKGGRAKVELGLGRSKKLVDKRETIKKRESDKQLRRALKFSKR